jgi:hypothetical protein
VDYTQALPIYSNLYRGVSASMRPSLAKSAQSFPSHPAVEENLPTARGVRVQCRKFGLSMDLEKSVLELALVQDSLGIQSQLCRLLQSFDGVRGG